MAEGFNGTLYGVGGALRGRFLRRSGIAFRVGAGGAFAARAVTGLVRLRVVRSLTGMGARMGWHGAGLVADRVVARGVVACRVIARGVIARGVIAVGSISGGAHRALAFLMGGRAGRRGTVTIVRHRSGLIGVRSIGWALLGPLMGALFRAVMAG